MVNPENPLHPIEYSHPVIAVIAWLESQIEGPQDSDPWIAYDSGLRRMDFGFRHVLRDLGFSSLRHVRDALVHPDRRPTGLELAGQGKTFVELGIDGLACCLAVPGFLVQPTDDGTRVIRKQSEPSSTKVALVAGDLAQQSTFAEIQDRFQQEAIEKPNLLLLAPAGGLGYLPEKQAFIDRIVRPAMELCDRDRFAFFGEVPEGTESLVSAFFETFRAETGAQTTLRRRGETPVFGIYRNKAI